MASEFKRPISPERYTDRPFLRLLDCYVLDTISQLDADQRGALKDMEAKLQKTFNSTGTWQQIVAKQMDFMPTVPEKIRAFWAGYLDHESKLGNSVCPNEFVVSFVSQNFPSLAEPLQ